MEVQYGSGTSWESAMQGHYKTKNEALLNFAGRHSGFTETLKDIETDNPYIKKGIDAVLKEKADREAKRKADDQKRDADYRANLERENKLVEQFSKVSFKKEKTKIASPEGSLPEQEGLSLGGLTITDNGSDGKWKKYNITHQQSGLLVADEFVSLKDAKVAIWRLMQIMDWDRPKDDVVNDLPKGLKLFMKQMRENPYVDYPDDLKESLKKGDKLVGKWSSTPEATAKPEGMTKTEYNLLVKDARTSGDRLYFGVSNPAKTAERVAGYLNVGYNIKKYDDGKVSLHTNNFKTFVFEPVKTNRKPLKDMSKAELKQLRVVLHILPDGTLEVKEKGADSLERQVASWNPPNRPDMTENSRVGGYISSPEKVSGEKVADDAKSWLDAVAKTYDLDMDEIIADSWRGGGMIHKASPYDYTTNTFTGKIKTVSGSDPVVGKTTDLQAIHDSRSPRSKESDERQSNADTIEPDDPRVEQWVKDQGRMDIVGIDTPRKGKSKKVTRKTRKDSGRRVGKLETQLRGLRR